MANVRGPRIDVVYHDIAVRTLEVLRVRRVLRGRLAHLGHNPSAT